MPENDRISGHSYATDDLDMGWCGWLPSTVAPPKVVSTSDR
ncbi:hypothetical protein A2U01_0083073, partial [Trifolium medium]|nr:hypothetical protein [Trifolium medium]